MSSYLALPISKPSGLAAKAEVAEVIVSIRITKKKQIFLTIIENGCCFIVKADFICDLCLYCMACKIFMQGLTVMKGMLYLHSSQLFYVIFKIKILKKSLFTKKMTLFY